LISRKNQENPLPPLKKGVRAKVKNRKPPFSKGVGGFLKRVVGK